MDIYSFLNSSDIAAHCRKIGKVFTPVEMAVIIYHSRRPFLEQLEGYRQIVRDTPDMPLAGRPWFDACDSFHNYLHRLIDHEKAALERFLTPEKRKLYLPDVIRRDRWCEYEFGKHGVFSTLEQALSHMKSQWEPEEVDGFDVMAVTVDSGGSEDGRCQFDYDAIVQDLYTVESEDTLSCLDGFYINIPTPFKRGDIVVQCGRFGNREPFVLGGLPCWQKPELVEYHLQNGDNTDMMAWGYGQEDGMLHHTSAGHYYFDLSLYCGELTGGNRLLGYLSLNLKKSNENDDYSPLKLIYLCQKIEAEERLRRAQKMNDGEGFADKYYSEKVEEIRREALLRIGANSPNTKV